MSEQDESIESASLVPVDRTALNSWRDEWQGVLAAYEAVPCDSAASEAQWVELRNHTHAALQERDEERKQVTGPLDREVKAINKWYREARAPAEAFKALANKKIGDYALAQSVAAMKAREAARLAAEAGNHEAAYEAMLAVPDSAPAAGNSVRLEWTYEVSDIAQVPDLYTKRVVDADAIAAYLKRMDPGHFPFVNGIKFTKTASVRPTGRKK